MIAEKKSKNWFCSKPCSFLFASMISRIYFNQFTCLSSHSPLCFLMKLAEKKRRKPISNNLIYNLYKQSEKNSISIFKPRYGENWNQHDVWMKNNNFFPRKIIPIGVIEILISKKFNLSKKRVYFFFITGFFRLLQYERMRLFAFI